MKIVVRCDDCKTYYFIESSTNYMAFCPECGKKIECCCELGFGGITPMNIWVGESPIGTLTYNQGDDFYRLKSFLLGIDLQLERKGRETLALIEQIISEKLK